jgi:hypothetical protein
MKRKLIKAKIKKAHCELERIHNEVQSIQSKCDRIAQETKKHLQSIDEILMGLQQWRRTVRPEDVRRSP